MKRTKRLLAVLAVFCGLGGLCVNAGAAPKQTPYERAKRIHETLVSGGALKGRLFLWDGKTFDVSGQWQICEAYAGICFKAFESGETKPKILAVFESASMAHGVGLMEVDIDKYKKDRTQEAIHWFIENGSNMQEVFKLQDKERRLLFDAAGNLTAAGDMAYETGLRGKSPSLTLDSAPKNAPRRRDCPHPKAVRQVKKLVVQGYVEIKKADYDCLHEFFPKYSDEEMNVKTVCDENRDRYFYLKSDSIDEFVVTSFRSKGKCPEHGTKLFQGK